MVYRVVWNERWTKALDSMLGMMVNSLIVCDDKSVHGSVHRSESICNEEGVMNDMKNDMKNDEDM